MKVVKLKKNGIVCCVLSVVFLILSFAIFDMEYYGFNDMAELIFEILPILIGMFGVVMLVAGIWYLLADMKKMVMKRGIVISKTNNVMIVEFEDGSRSNMFAPNNIVVGDKGEFGMKGGFLVEYRSAGKASPAQKHLDDFGGEY